MGRPTGALFFACISMLIRDFSDCCFSDTMVVGCRAEVSLSDSTRLECLCGVGCEVEFQYQNKAQCEAATKSGAALKDACVSSPCLNGGQCLQLRYGRHRCECSRTGFYGQSCEIPCPSGESGLFEFQDSTTPLECIDV